VARKRNDWQWKEARALVERFDLVWIEDLNLKGMKALASGPSKVALRKWPYATLSGPPRGHRGVV